MTQHSSDPPDPSEATKRLAALVAKRKGAKLPAGPKGGARESERSAAARSAARSKPALRK